MSNLIPLPKRALIGGSDWMIQESEGLIVFRETDGVCGSGIRLAFTRDDSNIGRVRFTGGPADSNGVSVGDILGCYRLVEAAYGGPFGGTMGENGRAQGPYDPTLMPCNQKKQS